MSGADNMRYDLASLTGIAERNDQSIFRLFRFAQPTVSYGRLQKATDIAAHVPPGWAVAQRPTGGGIVLHDGDLCLSLCWRKGEGPMPARPQEQYRWIHSVVAEALAEIVPVRMASCRDLAAPQEPFGVRNCFRNPVGFDLLDQQKKIVGGALRCTRRAILYQGSIHAAATAALEARLWTLFQARLAAA